MDNKKLAVACRILLGLDFFIFGLNGFFNFIPAPPFTGKASEFLMGLMATGYFFPFLKMTEVICGLLLILGIATPAVFIIVAPIIIHICLFHGFLTPGIGNLIMPVVMVFFWIIGTRPCWHLYRPLFRKG